MVPVAGREHAAAGGQVGRLTMTSSTLASVSALQEWAVS